MLSISPSSFHFNDTTKMDIEIQGIKIYIIKKKQPQNCPLLKLILGSDLNIFYLAM